jgi:glycosyltransferase involved in cell wall biosynthesis
MALLQKASFLQYEQNITRGDLYTMRFSIITITLNAEKFLERTLASVSQQTFKDCEHIIWDGGSKDYTLDIIKAYPHVKLFSGKDSGISDAMNRGAQFAQGDYIIHLHADDCLAHPNALTDVNKFLIQHDNPLWAYGRAEIIDLNDQIVRTTDLIPFEAKRLRKYNIITHPAVILSRQLFIDQGGFRTNLKYSMDYELWLRLAKTHRAMSMPMIVAQFREHHGSLSTREVLGVANEAYLVRNEYVKNLWERFQSYRTWKRRCRKLT